MGIGPISTLSSNYLQSILSAVENSGSGTNSTDNSSNGIGASSLSTPSDKSQLSPLAELMSALDQLQQSNPTKYQQVTQQISTNLRSAAQAATSEGNTAAANQLNQLATDFSNASQSGQLPNIRDLAQAVHGGHHHHPHAAPPADSSSSTDSTSSSTQNRLPDQLLSAFQANSSSSQSNSLNPMAIIFNTLSNAGIAGTGNS